MSFKKKLIQYFFFDLMRSYYIHTHENDLMYIRTNLDVRFQFSVGVENNHHQPYMVVESGEWRLKHSNTGKRS
jgi:hypothetical protein